MSGTLASPRIHAASPPTHWLRGGAAAGDRSGLQEVVRGAPWGVTERDRPQCALPTMRGHGRSWPSARQDPDLALPAPTPGIHQRLLSVCGRSSRSWRRPIRRLAAWTGSGALLAHRAPATPQAVLLLSGQRGGQERDRPQLIHCSSLGLQQLWTLFL